MDKIVVLLNFAKADTYQLKKYAQLIQSQKKDKNVVKIQIVQLKKKIVK